MNEWNQSSLGALFLDATQKYSSQIALRIRLGNWFNFTFAEWRDHSVATAALLKARGVCAGDRVWIINEAQVETAFLYPALALLGAIPLWVTPRLPDADLKFLLQEFNPQWLLADSTATLERLPSSIPSIVISPFEGQPLQNPEALAAFEPFAATGDCTVWVTLTSGQEGPPKLTSFTHRQALTALSDLCSGLNLPAGQRIASLQTDTSYLSPLDLLLPLTGGHSLIFSNRFHYAAAEAAPTLLISTSKNLEVFRDFGPALQRLLVLSRLSPQMRALYSHVPLLIEAYGLAEAGGPIALNGHVLPSIEIKIDAQNELSIRSHRLSPGWHPTGDIARLNDQNLLEIQDRKSSPPFSTPLELIEEAARNHPWIEDCFILPDQTALVSLNPSRVLKFADENFLLASSLVDLLKHPKIRRGVGQHLESLNQKFGIEIGRFLILPEEFGVHTGEYTRDHRYRRSNILEKYRTEIEALGRVT